MYEQIQQVEKHRICVSKIAMMMESEQLKHAREDIFKAKPKTLELLCG